MKPIFLSLPLCLVTLAVNLQGQVQAQTAKAEGTDTQLSEDISRLKKDIEALKANQKQLIGQIGEITRLLREHTTIRSVFQPPPSLEVRGEPFRGDRAAGVAIIEYADFECPFCGSYERDVYPQLFENYIRTGKVKYFYRDLPAPSHPRAMSAARAARCVGEQNKYWEMHDSLFAKQTVFTEAVLSERAAQLGIDMARFTDCLSSDKYADDIQERISEAQQIGIDGTPTFFLGTIGSNSEVVNIERSILGARPYKDFKTNLDDLLASAKDQARDP
jgi:protein-disulfide isomerase